MTAKFETKEEYEKWKAEKLKGNNGKCETQKAENIASEPLAS